MTLTERSPAAVMTADPARPATGHRARVTGQARRRQGGNLVRAATSRTQFMERITVALIPKVAEGLQRLQNRTNMSKTDIVNRAITLYEFIDAQLHADQDILIRDRNTQEVQSVMLL